MCEPAVWVALAAIIALLIAALGWSVFGTIDAVDAAGEATRIHPITFILN